MSHFPMKSFFISGLTGVVSPPGSWRKWPHHLLNPHQSETTEAAVSSSDTLATHTSPLSEKDGASASMLYSGKG